MQTPLQFSPIPGQSTTNIAVTAASQTLNSVAAPNIGRVVLRLCNVGTDVIFVTRDATADATLHMPIQPNTCVDIPGGPGVNTIAVIAAATNSKLYLTVGTSGL